MKLKKTLAIILAGLLAMSMLAGCGGSSGEKQETANPSDEKQPPTEQTASGKLDKIKERGKLIAGVKYDVPLFGMLNTQTNKVEGFEIDLMKELAKEIFGDENKIEFVQVQSKTRVPMLQNDQVDIVAGTMTITEERKQQIDFSDVYFEAGQSLLVKKDSPIKSIDDLKDKKVSSVQGSTSVKNIKEKVPSTKIVEFPTYPEAFLALQNGRADAMTTDNVILMGFAQQDPNTQLVGGLFTSEPYGFGFKKGNDDFTQFTNEWLKKVKESGKYNELYKKWLKEDAPK